MKMNGMEEEDTDEQKKCRRAEDLCLEMAKAFMEAYAGLDDRAMAKEVRRVMGKSAQISSAEARYIGYAESIAQLYDRVEELKSEGQGIRSENTELVQAVEAGQIEP